MEFKNDAPLFTIRIAAAEVGIHPQTLRLYETRGLITPKRSEGNTRLYSQRDIEKMKHIIELSNEGITTSGIEHILELENRIEELESAIDNLFQTNGHLKEEIMYLKEQLYMKIQPTAIVLRSSIPNILLK